MRFSRLSIALIVVLQTLTAGAIGLQQINTRALPSVDTYGAELDNVLQNESFLSGFIPDDYWKGPITKAQMAERLARTYSMLVAQKNDPPNQELCLLKGLICTYLYNLDQLEYFQKAVDNFNAVEDIPNHDYRFKWMLGMLFAKAAKPFRAIPQFLYVARAIPEDKLHPLFWMDYGYAAALAFMPATAMHCYETGSRYGGYDLKQDSLYQNLKKNKIIDDKSGTISKDELFGLFQRESGLGLFCRSLGIWLPIKEDWGLRMADYEKNQSFVIITPPAIKAQNGQDITYTIATFFRVTDEDVKSKWMESYKDYKQVNDLRIGPDYTVYEYADEKTYPKLGGSHGYIVFYKSPYLLDSDEAIESPTSLFFGTGPSGKPNNDGKSVSYYAFRPMHYRLHSQIHYVFLLVSCKRQHT